jgi:hypothetical protein
LDRKVDKAIIDIIRTYCKFIENDRGDIIYYVINNSKTINKDNDISSNSNPKENRASDFTSNKNDTNLGNILNDNS